jgi:phosphoesterase RecJ-like protein
LKRLVRSSKKIAIIYHHNADPDALGSAYALQRLLKRLNPKVESHLISPEGISGVSKRVVEIIGVEFDRGEEFDQNDAIFLVDTNTIQQLDDWKERVDHSNKPVVVIDHHARHPETLKIASLMFIDETATSTCEVLFRLYQTLRVKIDRKCARALLIGLTYDSAHFTIATPKTFDTAASLIRLGADLEQAVSTLTYPMSDSERMARLKAAQRIEVKKIGKWIIGTTKISSHQASAARALIGLGAHVAMAAGEKEGKLRISIRSQRHFNKETGIHLGRDVAKPLGEAIDGMGGGHESAAGINGMGQLDKVLSEFHELLLKHLKAS